MLEMAAEQMQQADLVSTASTKLVLAAVLAGAAAQLDRLQAMVVQASLLFVISLTQLLRIQALQPLAAPQQMAKRSPAHAVRGAATPHLLTRISGSVHQVLQEVTQIFRMQLR